MARVKQVSYHHSSHSRRYPQAIHDSKQKDSHNGLRVHTKSKKSKASSSRKDKRKLLKTKKPRLTKYECALAESINCDGAKVKLPEISKIYKSNSTCVRCAKSYPNIKLAAECLKLHNYARCTLCFDAIKNNLSVIDFVKQIHYDTHCKAIIRCPVYNLRQYDDLKEFRSYVEDVHTDVGVCRDHAELVDEADSQAEQMNEEPGENKTQDIIIPSSSPKVHSSSNSDCAGQSDNPAEAEKTTTITDFNDNEYDLNLNSSETTGDNKKDFSMGTHTHMEIVIDIDVQKGTSVTDSRLVIRGIREISEKTEAKHKALAPLPVSIMKDQYCDSFSEIRQSSQNESSANVNIVNTNDGKLDNEINLKNQNISIANPQKNSLICKRGESKSESTYVKCENGTNTDISTKSPNHGLEFVKKVSKSHEEDLKVDLDLQLQRVSPSVSSSSSSPDLQESLPEIFKIENKSNHAENPLKINLKKIKQSSPISKLKAKSSKTQSTTAPTKNVSLNYDDRESKKPKLGNQQVANGKKVVEIRDERKCKPKKSTTFAVPSNSLSPLETTTSVDSFLLSSKKQESRKLKSLKTPECITKPLAKISNPRKANASARKLHASKPVVECTKVEVEEPAQVKNDFDSEDASEYSDSSSDYSDIFEAVVVSKSFYLKHMKKPTPNNTPAEVKNEKTDHIVPVKPKDEVITFPEPYKGMPCLQIVQPVIPQDRVENSEPPILICYVPKAIDHELDNIVLSGENSMMGNSMRFKIPTKNSKAYSSIEENIQHRIAQDKCVLNDNSISPSRRTEESKYNPATVGYQLKTHIKLLNKAKKKQWTSVLSISKGESSAVFPCKKCPKKFASSFLLSRHVNINHFEVCRFVCNLCSTPKGFRDGWNLRRHATRVHKTVIPPFQREPGVVRTLQ